MAYNNYFPTGYYQYPQYQPQQTSNSIVWVGSEAEAQSYPVAPNNAVVLWDSSKASVYLKQADASGRPTFKAYDLVEHQTVNNSGFDTAVDKSIHKDDIDALRGDIGVLIEMLKSDIDSKKKVTKRKETDDGEQQSIL